MPRRSLVEMGFAKSEVNLTVIAKKLGISVSTVSRALRNVANTHPLTRQKILEEARSMGYTWEQEKPAAPAPRNILMLSQVANASLDGPYLSGLSRAAVEMNLSLLAHHFKPEECEQIMNPALQPPALKSGTVEGVVLLHRWPVEVVRKLSRQVPLVSIIHNYPGTDIDVVGIDEREGMIDLVRHLVAAGYRKIGFFGFCRHMSWARSRLGAYVEALAEMELEYEPDRVIEVSLKEALAEDPIPSMPATAKVVERLRQGVKAWIGTSEILGYSLCRGLLDLGLKIPQDAAVTGFHASPRSNVYGLPLLTSTSTSSEELGAAALRRLVVHIENPEESRRSILLPCTYTQGQTTPSVKVKPLDDQASLPAKASESRS